MAFPVTVLSDGRNIADRTRLVWYGVTKMGTMGRSHVSHIVYLAELMVVTNFGRQGGLYRLEYCRDRRMSDCRIHFIVQ